MAHLQAVDQHVHRSFAGHVHEVGLLVAEQRVVPLVWRVALLRQEVVERDAVLRAGREVEVDLDTSRPGGPIRCVRPDRHAAHEPDLQTAFIGQVHDPHGFGQGVLQRAEIARVAGVTGHRPSSNRPPSGVRCPLVREYRLAVRRGKGTRAV
jgi:hypothetical protein